MEVNPLVGVAVLLLITYVFLYLPRSQIRQTLVFVILFMIGSALVLTVAEMPFLGCANTPANNYVAQRYIEGAVSETGAINVVTAIILDYRAFDTLGEATVLFVAIAAAIANLRAH